jgi:CHAT domain-containing protein
MLAKLYRAKADWHRIRGENGAASVLYEKALKAMGDFKSKPLLAHAELLEVLAKTYADLRRFNDAVMTAKQAIEIREHLQGPTEWAVSTLHELIGTIEIQELRNPRSAVEHFKQALRIREQLLPNHPETAKAAFILASAYEAIGQAAEAVEAHELSIRIINTVREPSHPDRLAANTALANFYVTIGFYDLAYRTARATIDALDESRPDVPPKLVITLLNTLALALLSKSEYGSAVIHCQRALGLCASTPESELMKAQVLRNMARSLTGMADYMGAQKAAEDALAIQRREFGDSEPAAIAATLVTLAHCFHSVGRVDRSINLLKASIEMCRKGLGDHHPETAFSTASLAEAYRSLGDVDLATAQYKFAHSSYLAYLGARHPITVMSQINIASVLCDANDFEEAVSVCESALGALDARLGTDHHFMATALNTYAIALGGLGRISESTTQFEKSLQIRKRLLGQNHPDYAICQANLAMTLQRNGQLDAARELYESALATLIESLGIQHPSTVDCSAHLAIVLHSQGKVSASIWRLKQDINALQEQRNLVSAIGKGELASYTKKVSNIYQTLASWLIDDGRFPDALHVLDLLKESEYFEFIRRSETADPRKSRVAFNNDEMRWVGRYDEIVTNLASAGMAIYRYQLAQLGNGDKNEDSILIALRAQLTSAQLAYKTFLADMDAATDSLASGSTAVAPESIEFSRKKQEMVASLGTSTALVSYVLLHDHVCMILTTEREHSVHKKVVDLKELTGLAFSFWASLSEEGSDFLPLAKRLYELLFFPLESAIKEGSKTTIILSLDGALRYIPFGALHDGHEFLLERLRFPTYSPAAQELIVEKVQVEWTVAGFGTSRSFGNLPPLPYVVEELNSIIGRNGTGVLSGDVYLDERFTAEALRGATRGHYSVAHIASHFVLSSSGTEENSYLLLGDGSELTLRELREGSWNFSNFDLLALSACQTGLGGSWNRDGKEIDGLATIAQHKGARGVLATLWKVWDHSTPIIMKRFYEAHQYQHLSKIDALRASQLSMLESQYSHPCHWAPFILVGNWQ